ncbi:MAG: hypothetical protein HY934_00880 [Candidatus Firestonebacteria bacterium]|nr:hypothetical protein [Candidatus Firestonebacteria bacterium]
MENLSSAPVIKIKKNLRRTKTLNHKIIYNMENNYHDLTKIIISITHEIRNPLSAIELFASLQFEELSAKHQDTSLTMDILTGVNRINNVITNLLYYASLPDPHFVKLNLKEMIEETLRFTYHALKLNSIDIHFEMEDKNIFIFADKEQIKQCFMNLILNSLKHLPDGGHINIKTKSTQIDDMNILLSIEFSDSREINNGYDSYSDSFAYCGIDNLAQNINHNKDMNIGDIGFPIVQKIITKHNGRSEIKNSPEFKVNIFIPCIIN